MLHLEWDRCFKVFHSTFQRERHVCKLKPVEQWQASTRLEFEHESRLRVICAYCPYVVDVDFWSEHYNSFHKDKPYIRIVNPYRDSLTVFEPTTPNSTVLRCPYCPHTASKYWAARHVKSKHPAQPVPKLPPHLTSAKRPREQLVLGAEDEPDPGYVKCSRCPLAVSVHRYRHHLREKHAVPDIELPPPAELSASHSTSKSRRQRGTPRLSHHMLTHRNETPLEPKTSASHPYYCALCDTRYLSRSGLSHHISVSHPAHPVGYLDSPSATESTLAIHMREMHGAPDDREKVDFRPPSEETPEHLLQCPALMSLRSSFEFAVKELRMYDIFTHKSLSQFLCALFGYPDPLLTLSAAPAST
eukprot:gene12089-8315_t